ncbi:PREDICTED: cryptochrome DASH-like [Acropora digitifera]|uniref:cryptochrome DASH-like n=1 Tax=Acropora digitifera TaxID=70779 RepID=UPI00077AD0F0|nr:PREDICTED: cryptochrome DASH-like [Acropora digitifera]
MFHVPRCSNRFSVCSSLLRRRGSFRSVAASRRIKVTLAMDAQTSNSIAIYLIRNDLRVHDNECLGWAQQNADFVIPLFCFDKEIFGHGAETWHFKFPKTAIHRARFILESVVDLKDSLKKGGSDLLLRSGQTMKEAVLRVIQLCRQQSIQNLSLVYQREITKEEKDVEAELLELCKKENVAVKSFWGLTLYHVEDLPFASVRHLPDTYTEFRKSVEARCRIRPVIPAPNRLKPIPDFITSDNMGGIPTLTELVKDQGTTPDARSAFPFCGGETAAIERMDNYLWTTDNVSKYKETRNGLIGAEYSTKLSPWLAVGALSPRKIYECVKQYEKERTANQSTYWVLFELLWRDYFKFVCFKFGDSVFYLSGIMKKGGLSWKQDMSSFDKWRFGQTGVPFVDANMRELLYTGWMSNRGRQNVASFLVKDLGLDWRLGAEWFESLLVDHDVCSNYGNWNYSAGIGNDPRENRKFNMIKQAFDYDADGDFVRLWVPELVDLKGARVHIPWTLTSSELKVAGITLGESYPRPMVNPPEWKRHTSKVKGSGNSTRRHNRGIDFYFKSPKDTNPSKKRH